MILFLRAESWISCICADFVARQFCMYRRVKAGSSGRDLVLVSARGYSMGRLCPLTKPKPDTQESNTPETISALLRGLPPLR